MKIAILGAGIGGLTMAQCLYKKNIAFDLYESSPSIKPVGAGIWMPPNAMQIFSLLNLENKILSHGVALKSMQLLDLNMKPLSTIEGGALASKYLFPTVSIKRHELHRILMDSLPKESVFLDHHCESLQIKNTKAHLLFKNGKQQNYDLVIAADGIHSLTRKSIGDKRELLYSGQTCFRGITNLEITDDFKNLSMEIWGQGARFGCSPVDQNQVYWYAPFVNKPHEKFTPEQKINLLKTVYKSFPQLTQKIIQATSPDQIIHTDLFELSPSKHSWARGPIYLLGDAAHSMTPNLGQGAAMAIEDAFVLSELISTLMTKKTHDHSSLSHHESFVNYELLSQKYTSSRLERVNKIASWARQLGALGGWSNSFLCFIRNKLISNTPARLQDEQVEFIYKGYKNQ